MTKPKLELYRDIMLTLEKKRSLKLAELFVYEEVSYRAHNIMTLAVISASVPRFNPNASPKHFEEAIIKHYKMLYDFFIFIADERHHTENPEMMTEYLDALTALDEAFTTTPRDQYSDWTARCGKSVMQKWLRYREAIAPIEEKMEGMIAA